MTKTEPTCYGCGHIRDLLRQADQATRQGDHDKARSLHARAMAQAGRVTVRQS